jgi:hypothetical protein
MKIRIQNNAKGERGFYVGKELVFVVKGSTATFGDATAGDVRNAAKVDLTRVWKSEDGKDWEEVTPPEAVPDDRQFLAIASGPKGEAMRVVPLAAGEWYVGTALASAQPDGAGGYTWEKIGGGVEAANEPAPVEPESFDATALVEKNAVDVISALDGMDADQLNATLDAEKARDKPRKGVIEAIEEKLTA